MRVVDAICSVARAAIDAACAVALVRQFFVAMCIAGLIACMPPKIDYGVPDGHAPDADETGAPPNPELCFGTGAMRPCLVEAPSMPRDFSVETVIDTDALPMCAMQTHGGNFCVVAATTLSINATLRATGSRPLVLLASESITIGQNGVVDVGSHSSPGSEPGAGHDPPLSCDPPVSPPMTANYTSGGGAGGSLATAGAPGGNGVGGGGAGGVPARGEPVSVTDGPASVLRGGCSGQRGGDDAGGAGGHGGGAVLFIAGTVIDVEGKINAGGEGGKGGGLAIGALTTLASGGGGGGAGGMIGFDAPLLTTNTTTPWIRADGGGGGQGASTDHAGRPGLDSNLLLEAATGGSGNGNIGGSGGAGSLGGLGMGAAKDGLTGGGSIPPGPAGAGGGGGGGGGAGVIIVPGNYNLGKNVSPPSIPSS